MISKAYALEQALKNGPVVVIVDALDPEVYLPPSLKGPGVVLKFAQSYAPFDLEISLWGIRQTLSFQVKDQAGVSRPFKVAVPWKAIIGLFDERDTFTIGWPHPRWAIGFSCQDPSGGEAVQRPVLN